jgi:hypothetical protein
VGSVVKNPKLSWKKENKRIKGSIKANQNPIFSA